MSHPASPMSHHSPRSDLSGSRSGRFSHRQPDALERSVERERCGNGTTLFVDGLARTPVKGGGAGSSFRSQVPHAQGHLKSVAHRMDDAARIGLSPRSPRSRSASPNADTSYRSTDGFTPRSCFGEAPPVGRPSSVFQSRVPHAVAHLKNSPARLDKLYEPQGHTIGAGVSRARQQRPSASFASRTSKGDSHIRAAKKINDVTYVGGVAARVEAPNAVFRSTAPQACSHILAQPKMVDVCTAWRETDAA